MKTYLVSLIEAKTMEEKFLEIDGNKVRYLESGDSEKTLVLIHGLGASAERWSALAPLLTDQYHVIVPDLIGFGFSDKPLADYTLEFFSDFLEKFFSKLNITYPHLIGSSLGGQISVEFAVLYPELVDKLILVSPSGIMKQSTPALDAYIMAALYPNQLNAQNAFDMMDGSNSTPSSETVDGFIQRMRLPNAKLAFMSTILGLKNAEIITKKLQSLLAQTLIIWGSDDPVIPIKHSGEFVASIKNCTFHKMDGCGHAPYVEDPVAFCSIVLDFLQNDRV